MRHPVKIGPTNNDFLGYNSDFRSLLILAQGQKYGTINENWTTNKDLLGYSSDSLSLAQG